MLLNVPISYQLPWEIVREVGPGVYQYRLLIQKQPGTPPERATVLVQLPTGAQLAEASPGEPRRQGSWLRFDLTMTGDQLVRVQFALPGAPSTR